MLMIAYGAALALLLDPHAVPGLVEAAYRGESWGPLNRILEGRSQYPLDHYMSKWHALSRGLVVALVGAATATLAARLAWGRSRQVISLAAMAPALALVAVHLGPTSSQDYAAHLEMWEWTLAGGDPWAVDAPKSVPFPHPGYSWNAYGPLFNLLAIPAWVHPLAPKVLYAMAWAAILASLFSRDRWIAWAVVPLALWEAVRGGRFDILVAICLLAALRDYLAGRDVAAGGWIGVGFLLKFLPLVVLPFLALDRRRLRWKLVLSALTISAVGFALAIWIWGLTPPFQPLRFNAQRPSGGTGLFAFTRYVMGFNLDRWSGPTIAVSLAALMAWSVAHRPALVPTALAALGLVLAFHKASVVTHSTFLVVPLAWYVTEGTDRMLRRATILYAGWASTCVVIIISVRQHVSDSLGQALMFAAGLPTCIVTLALVTALLRRARAEGQERESDRVQSQALTAANAGSQG